MNDKPLAYFITFTTYGTWLHGDKRGSTIIKKGKTEILKQTSELQNSEFDRLKCEKVYLTIEQKKIVLETVISHCSLKNWKLYAANILNNHVHLAIQADVKVEKIMSDLKAWSTRKLREAGFEMPKVWTKHGSTIYIFQPGVLQEKIEYVLNEQPDNRVLYQIDVN